MKYLEQDIWYFVKLGPHLRMATYARSCKFIAAQAQKLIDFKEILEEYPHVQIENLAFWYGTLRGLGMLDSDSLEGMLTRCTWRGAIWGGWLALLAPRSEYAPLLEAVPRLDHGNEWAVRCALTEIAGQPLAGPYEEMRRLARMCRHHLRTVPILPMPLRLQPSAENLQRLEQERSRIRAAYMRGGVDTARRTLAESVFSELTEDYPQWYRRHEGIPSRRNFVDRLMNFERLLEKK